MNRRYSLFSVVILMCILVGTFASCNSFDFSSLKESEQAPLTSADDEQESVKKADSEEPNPLSKIVGISLDGNRKSCRFDLGDQNGSQTCLSLTGVKKVLFNINNRNEYSEVNNNYAMKIDGEEKVLTHVIVVFQKGHKLTENDKNVLKKFDMDYMFEK